MEQSKGQYTSEKQITAATEVYTKIFENRKSELSIVLEKLTEALIEVEPTNA